MFELDFENSYPNKLAIYSTIKFPNKIYAFSLRLRCYSLYEAPTRSSDTVCPIFFVRKTLSMALLWRLCSTGVGRFEWRSTIFICVSTRTKGHLLMFVSSFFLVNKVHAKKPKHKPKCINKICFPNFSSFRSCDAWQDILAKRKKKNIIIWVRGGNLSLENVLPTIL